MSRIAISRVDPASDADWDSAWMACPYSTFFHSREWATLWMKYTAGRNRPAPERISFSDGTSAILPASIRKGRWSNHHLLSPGGTFGGWISADDLTESHTELLTAYILQQYPNFNWRLNPYAPAPSAGHVSAERIADETHVLELTNGFDEVVRGWTKGHRSAASKARRSGVTVRPADSLTDWQRYFEIYQESLDRWGDTATSRYGWKFFEFVWHAQSPWIRLWLAHRGSDLLAGALCLYAPQHVSYWHGAAAQGTLNLRPVHLLMYEAIEHACEAQKRWFDFNPSGGHEGVAAFKQSFGAERRDCLVVRQTRLRDRTLQRVLAGVSHCRRWIR